MASVVDANIMVRLAQNDPLSNLIEQRLTFWIESEESLHAPSLFLYEAANALVRSAAAGKTAKEELPRLWDRILVPPIKFHIVEYGLEVMDIAFRLGRQNAYDAVYIALALRLDATLWTMDGPLYRNASQKGFPVRLIEAS